MFYKRNLLFILVTISFFVSFQTFAVNLTSSLQCKSKINSIAKSSKASYLNKLSNRKESKIEKVLRSEEIENIININEIDELKTLSVNEVFLVTFKDGTQGIWKEHIEGNPSSYKAEVLAYEFDRANGFNLVPITIEKSYKNKKGSLQLFVNKDTNIDYELEDFDRQRLFDFLIDNGDRHDENYFISTEGQLVSIDNGLGFFNIEGAHRETFLSIRSEMDELLESKQGKAILRKLRKNLKDEGQLKTIEQYLGKNNTSRLIARIEFILEYSKIMNSSIKDDVQKLYKIKKKSFNRSMMIVDLIKSHPIASKDKEEILLDILQRKDSTDELLASALNALRYYGLSKDIKRSITSKLLKHPKAQSKTRKSISSFLNHNN